jgi:hypothetical protein
MDTKPVIPKSFIKCASPRTDYAEHQEIILLEENLVAILLLFNYFCPADKMNKKL